MLTEREKEIMELVIKGLTSKEISKELNIAEQTVKAHKENIYYKLDVHNKVQAVIKYLQLKNQ